MRRQLVVALAMTLATVLSGVRTAEGQIGRLIKDRAKQKVEARKEQAESAAVKRADQAVDSSLTKVGRGVDSTISKTGTLLDTAMNKTERGVTKVARAITPGGKSDADKVTAELATGRAVLTGIVFVEGTADLDPSAESQVKALAKALASAQGVFLIEGHVASGGDAAADQALSIARATTLKNRLVTEGIPAARLYAMGLGGSKPPAAGQKPARIEVARMQ